MTKDEFTSLPLPIALSLLWEKSSGLREAMERTPAPPRPRSPKFDQAIYRKGGVMWASECDVETLSFWMKRYLESAEKGGEYAEKDRKRASSLSFWITWRLCNPTAVWSGERNREQVTASPVSDRPFVYEKEPRRDDTYEEPPVSSDGGGDWTNGSEPPF